MEASSGSVIGGTLIPSLEKELKLTYAMLPRRDGGAFLKRVHVIEPNYASVTISAEGRHASALTERFSSIEGKLPRVAFLLLALTLFLFPSLIFYPLLVQQSIVRWLVSPCTWRKSVMTCSMQQRHWEASYNNQQSLHGMHWDVW